MPSVPSLPDDAWLVVLSHVSDYGNAATARLVDKKASSFLLGKVAFLQRKILWTACLLHCSEEGALHFLRVSLFNHASVSQRVSLIVSLCHSELRLTIMRLVLDWTAHFPSDFSLSENELLRFAHCFFQTISRPPCGLYVLEDGQKRYLLSDEEKPYLLYAFSSKWQGLVCDMLREVWGQRG